MDTIQMIKKAKLKIAAKLAAEENRFDAFLNDLNDEEKSILNEWFVERFEISLLPEDRK